MRYAPGNPGRVGAAPGWGTACGAFCIFGHKRKCPANMTNVLLQPKRHKSDGVWAAGKCSEMWGCKCIAFVCVGFMFWAWVSASAGGN